MIPRSKPIDVSALTTELKTAVPSLNGLTDQGDTLIVKRLGGGAFTDEEAETINRIVAAHDAEAIRVRRMNQFAQQTSERMKDPLTLTVEQRVHRLEVLLGVEAT